MRRPLDIAEVESEGGTCMLLDANVPGLARDGLPPVAPADLSPSSSFARWRPSLRNPAAIAMYPPRSGEANRGKSVHVPFGVEQVPLPQFDVTCGVTRVWCDKLCSHLVSSCGEEHSPKLTDSKPSIIHIFRDSAKTHVILQIIVLTT